MRTQKQMLDEWMQLNGETQAGLPLTHAGPMGKDGIYISYGTQTEKLTFQVKRWQGQELRVRVMHLSDAGSRDDERLSVETIITESLDATDLLFEFLTRCMQKGLVIERP